MIGMVDAILTHLCRKSVVPDIVDTTKILSCLCRKCAVIDMVDTISVCQGFSMDGHIRKWTHFH